MFQLVSKMKSEDDFGRSILISALEINDLLLIGKKGRFYETLDCYLVIEKLNFKTKLLWTGSCSGILSLAWNSETAIIPDDDAIAQLIRENDVYNVENGDLVK